jgi:hypothetical protein
LVVSLLTRELALARFGVVVVIETLALITCFLPLVRAKDQWQKDCRAVGIVAALAMLILCVLVFAVASFAPRSVNDETFVGNLELSIIATYILNVAFLLLVIARTGGPTSSLYGTLIPIQLSAMLFLQLEKDRLAGKTSLGYAIFYVAIGLVGYLTAYLLRNQIRSWRFLFAEDPSPVDYAAVNARWTAGLTIGAMLLSFLTYAIPTDEHVVSKIRSWYASERMEKK